MDIDVGIRKTEYKKISDYFYVSQIKSFIVGFMGD